MNAWRPPVSSCSARDAQHVIDALLDRLDVAVEHRDVGAHAEPVRDAVDREVAIGVRTCRAQIFWRTRSAKISAPPPGSESRPAVLQLAQHLLVGHAVEIGEERDLDRGEALQVDVGPDRA